MMIVVQAPSSSLLCLFFALLLNLAANTNANDNIQFKVYLNFQWFFVFDNYDFFSGSRLAVLDGSLVKLLLLLYQSKTHHPDQTRFCCILLNQTCSAEEQRRLKPLGQFGLLWVNRLLNRTRAVATMELVTMLIMYLECPSITRRRDSLTIRAKLKVASNHHRHRLTTMLTREIYFMSKPTIKTNNHNASSNVDDNYR